MYGMMLIHTGSAANIMINNDDSLVSSNAIFRYTRYSVELKWH